LKGEANMSISQHRNFFILLIFTAFVFLSSVGCFKNSRPSDLPKLFPCKIIITQEEQPLEGATVTLLSKNSSSSGRTWIISGRTNANGETYLVTQPDFPGAPEGEYKVLIEKTETDSSAVPSFENDPEAFAKWAEKTKGVVPTYSFINPDLAVKQKTPFEIKISKGQNNAATFDAGKAIRVQIR
jgi:hypothetical protein